MLSGEESNTVIFGESAQKTKQKHRAKAGSVQVAKHLQEHCLQLPLGLPANKNNEVLDALDPNKLRCSQKEARLIKSPGFFFWVSSTIVLLGVGI